MNFNNPVPEWPGGGLQHRIYGFDSRPDFQLLSIVELVKTPDCDSGNRGFESRWTTQHQGARCLMLSNDLNQAVRVFRPS